jgi:hypothetical protein
MNVATTRWTGIKKARLPWELGLTITEELNNTKHHKNILGIKYSKKQNKNIWHMSEEKRKEKTNNSNIWHITLIDNGYQTRETSKTHKTFESKLKILPTFSI